LLCDGAETSADRSRRREFTERGTRTICDGVIPKRQCSPQESNAITLACRPRAWFSREPRAPVGAARQADASTPRGTSALIAGRIARGAERRAGASAVTWNVRCGITARRSRLS
jgi:hypothetical protein